MTRPSKRTVEPLLDEWARLTARAKKIESQRDAEIQKLKEAYDKKCAPILSEAKQKLTPIQERLNTLNAEINKQLLSGVQDDGTVALQQVATESAIAEVKSKEGARVINAEKFFDFTPVAKRDARFWGCVNILVGKAEKFLGDAINTISTKTPDHKVEIKLKQSSE